MNRKKKITGKQVISGGPDGLKIELDPAQIFPKDPGQGRPVLVVLIKGHLKFIGTWNCVTTEGYFDGIRLTPEQKYWLEGRRHQVETWMKEYNV